jgi:site-specific DNA recombinase
LLALPWRATWLRLASRSRLRRIETMRTVIYARYSSALQNSRSIDQQIEVCRERAERESWEVVEIFTDAAISGGAGIDDAQRPGLAGMLTRVEQGDIAQVLVDTTSRLARNQGDAHHIRDRINFAGARIFSLGDGEIDRFKGAIKGLLDEQQRVELRHNIKRGQRDTIRAGRAAAGLAYGYRTANRIDDRGRPVRGLRVIDEQEAETIRRIFTEFAAGISPRQIALRLNTEGVAGPRGRPWRGSTINGDRKRQNGILQNRLYAGELVHNRTSKLIDPRTRKVRIRPNPESDWIVEPAEALRIVPVELWEAVQQRRAATAHIPWSKQQRPKRLLSGLAVCGVCGGGWNVIGAERWGCTNHRDGDACSNNRSITTEQFERRVLDGLQQRMLDPDLVSAFVTEYHREHARKSADATRQRAQLEQRAAAARSKVERLVEALAEGAGEFAEIKDILARHRADRDAAEAELRELESLPIIALHPGIADRYRQEVAALTASHDSDEARRIHTAPILRSLLDRIVITPSEKLKGVHIEVIGRLTSLLALATGQPAPASECMVPVERVRGIEPL